MRVFLIVIVMCCGLAAFSQPEKDVKKQVDSLILFIKNKATESFAANTVYRGTDAKRKWKDAYNPANPEELKAAKTLMEKMKKELSECTYQEFDTFKQEVEAEGTWYVYTYACGRTKKIHLAFLKIKSKYLLGDIDVEEENDDD